MGDPKRIMIIEDNAAFRKMLKLRLESAGYQTLGEEDGLKGLNAVKEQMPDLVFLDIMLPGMDGHKVCRLLKFDKSFQHIPIIIFTSRDLDEDADLAKQCGADAFILKTTRPEIILDVVRQLLAEHPAGTSA
jgi:two-component system, OmpR family, alkaline phosphatase synthesis response regulator PhoP